MARVGPDGKLKKPRPKTKAEAEECAEEHRSAPILKIARARIAAAKVPGRR